MNEALLKTKLSMPLQRPQLVPRPELCGRLSEGVSQGRRLTLVSAPPGYGKTTLVAEWVANPTCERRAAQGAPAAQPSWRTAWLALDEEDSDPARFLSYLVASLQTVHEGIGREASRLVESAQPPALKPAMAALINEIGGAAQPLVLVLDDYHLLKSDVIHEAVAFLLERPPAQLHIVITTREDPPFPLPRWRARGQLTEIRETDLRFSEREAALLLNDIMGLKLAPDLIEVLSNKTEGWISGLQLAGLSMRGRADVDRFIHSFAGSNRYILDYLIEEVFQQQTPIVQDFLLKTSILEQLSAPLCDAVLWGGEAARGDSQETLERLEQANLFIVPLDETRAWFRYHHLFCDLLRQRLRVAGEDQSELHRRAAEWHEAHGYLQRATNHFLAAEAWEDAARLILLQSDVLQKRGENTTFLRWMAELPDTVIERNPALCLEYAWALALSGQPLEAERTLQIAEKAYRDNPVQYGKVLAAQIHVARIRHDWPQTIALSRRALSLIPASADGPRCALNLNLGIAQWQSGQLAEAHVSLGAAQAAAERAGNHHVQLLAMGFMSMILAARAELHQAAQLLGPALAWGGELPASALPHLVLGALLYEWDRLEEAGSHLQKAIDLAGRSGNSELESSAYRQWALLKQAQGEPAAAQAALEQALQAAGDNGPALTLARTYATAIVLALADNDVAAAQQALAQMPAEASASPFFAPLFLAPARLALAQGDRQAAAAHLAEQLERAAAGGWRYGQIEIHLLQALAAGAQQKAVSHLAAALSTAEAGGFVRIFIDKGPELVPLLHVAASQEIAPAYARELLAHLAGVSPPGSDPTPPAAPGSPMLEPLSERELEVLQLLAAGQTYQEIAQTMVVSVNTVKSHLKSIYGKLDVHNRREAVARARSLNLLS